MDGDPFAENPNLLDDILRKELDTFTVFEAVAAAAMVRRTRYTAGKSGKRYPSKTTIYGAIPVANEHVEENEEPASGLVLSKREIVPQGRMFEGLFYGEDYFDGQSDRIVAPCLTVISSMIPDKAAVLYQIKRPAIQVATNLDGMQERTVYDATFVLDDKMELDFQQSRYADWLGLLALRLPM